MSGAGETPLRCSRIVSAFRHHLLIWSIIRWSHSEAFSGHFVGLKILVIATEMQVEVIYYIFKDRMFIWVSNYNAKATLMCIRNCQKMLMLSQCDVK